MTFIRLFRVYSYPRLNTCTQAAAEVTLRDSLSRALDVMETLHDADLYPLVIFKLTLPEDPTLYDSFVR